MWNHEYRAGQWDSRHLHTVGDPIYDVLAKYCVDKNICDIGSGHGNTIMEMCPLYRSYTGVDISDAALSVATQRAAAAGRTRARFVQGFMHSYAPDSKPDIFLFRESLMYVPRWRSQTDKALACFLRRYGAMLAPGGMIIVRLCRDTPPEEQYAVRVEDTVRQIFDVVERRTAREPAALMLVFRVRAGDAVNGGSTKETE